MQGRRINEYGTAPGPFPLVIPEVAITSPVYGSRWWWVPATVSIVAGVSAIQVAAEWLWLGRGSLDTALGSLLLAHVIAAVICVAVFGTIRAARSGRTSFLGYSERYLVGLGYGIVTSLTIAIAAGILAGTSAANAVETIGMLMVLSLLSMELPVACIVGGLTWHLLSKVRGGVTRPRRPIEDPE